MKFSKKLKSILFFALALLLVFSSVVLADNLEAEPIDESDIMLISENPNAESNVVERNLYIVDSSITIDYPVIGNVFVMGNDVTISSNISGNVFVLAQSLKIESNGSIDSTLFACAEKITIDGTVSDIYSISNSLVINSGALVRQDITSGGSTFKFGGNIGRNADLAFDEISVTSDSASIMGDLSYSSKSASIPGDIVYGTTSFNLVEVEKVETKDIIMNKLNNLYTLLVISIVIILIVIYAIPKFADKEQKIVENKLAATFGYGALALILIPVACFVLFCTILGILPSIALLLVYIFILFQASSSIVSIAISRVICKKINKNSKGFNLLFSILLVIAIWLLEQVPVLGIIVSLLTSILGLGIIVYAIFHSTIESKNNKDDSIVAQASTIIEANGKNDENK